MDSGDRVSRFTQRLALINPWLYVPGLILNGLVAWWTPWNFGMFVVLLLGLCLALQAQRTLARLPDAPKALANPSTTMRCQKHSSWLCECAVDVEEFIEILATPEIEYNLRAENLKLVQEIEWMRRKMTDERNAYYASLANSEEELRHHKLQQYEYNPTRKP